MPQYSLAIQTCIYGPTCDFDNRIKLKIKLLVSLLIIFQIETREDEEQSQKLQEIIDLLIAAGYFRARIKGLSPFDKVRQLTLIFFLHICSYSMFV